jgi:hypothetical protein
MYIDVLFVPTGTTEDTWPVAVASEDPGAVRASGGGLETISTNATASGAVTINLANGNVHTLTLTGNVTLTVSGVSVGKACSFTLILTQDGTGSRTVTWPTGTKWAGGTAPVLSTGASKVDVLTFHSVDGGSTWRGFLAGLDMR